MQESSLNAALRHFEAVEANLVKAEKVLEAIYSAVPQGIVFGESPQYEQDRRDFEEIFASLPKIDGWKPDVYVMGLDEIAQSRLDAREVGEIECLVYTENQIDEPSRLLRDYRYRFSRKRRELVRDALLELIDNIDGQLRVLAKLLDTVPESNRKVESEYFEALRQSVAQIEMLLGSNLVKPPRWSDLHRHLAFGLFSDLHDIIAHDWPVVKVGLRKSMYGERDPVPVEIEDIGELVSSKPRGPVATRLKWEVLAADDFERLVFSLIASENGYENPEWLMRTNAPDRGRDLSVYRVHDDALCGTIRHRVIIQCKHWQSRSVDPVEVATSKEQMKLWEPPRVDVHVIATSGRFTSDAVALIERHNQSESALRIEMWPESHLERLLAARPAIIAEFGLR